MAFQNLRAPLTVLLGLGLRVSVGDDNSYRGDLDAMMRGGMDRLSAANPFALAWSQALPNIVNLVGSCRSDGTGFCFGRLLSSWRFGLGHKALGAGFGWWDWLWIFFMS